ncbi:MAG: C2 family cysteine protease, partial [Polyangiaceae bacterium]
MGKRSRGRRGLIADTRGASLVEYMLVVGAVGIVSIAGYRAFGSSVQARAEAQARCVETFDCGGNGAPTPGTGTAASGVDDPSWNPFASVRSGNPNPAFGNIPGGRNATYQTIPGVPTVQGAGDATAVHPNDVGQGQIGDCYLISAMAAVANRNPQLIQDAVVANSDGSYTVTFYERAAWYNPFDSGYHPVQIRVTGDFPAVNGNPVFAQPGDGTGAGRELWPMIVEKAYAQWQGGYDRIGTGGTAGGPMSALTGRDSVQYGGRNWQNWVGWGVEMDTVATA